MTIDQLRDHIAETFNTHCNTPHGADFQVCPVKECQLACLLELAYIDELYPAEYEGEGYES